MAIQLNAEQEKPARELKGAILVTAGAGSGKTRLLTQRIANIVDSGVDPYHILCITFTNKAANEMKERLSDVVNTSNMWIMTFHAMCVRILRMYIDKLGYHSNFTIYGEAEKERILKQIVKDMNLDADPYVKRARFMIGDMKNDECTIDEFIAAHEFEEQIKTYGQIIAKYTEELKRNNALDFDDLLIVCYQLLCAFPDVLDKIQERFQYLSVDEFQDTNAIQYKIVKKLAAKYGNIFAVGDEDQSIYGWRGANIQNMFDFKKDFSAKVYKLEQNYRSTKKILDAANQIISHNTTRLVKNLWTENGEGAKIEKYTAYDDRTEADYVIENIINLATYSGYKYGEMAILMRLNALTRPFEERLLSYNVNYQVYGGFKFYERKEIKDILAYMRMLNNPADGEAVLRVINLPKRGIGDMAIAQLRNYSLVKNVSIREVCRTIATNAALPSALVKKVMPFGELLNDLITYMEQNTLTDTVEHLIKRVKFREMYHEKSEENISRLANIDQFCNSVQEYESNNTDGSLAGFLENVTLMSDLDGMDDHSNAVSLATVHSAKGLEFKVVFVVGLDETIFPILRDGTDNEMEEERRLMYVAVTRAKERLYLTRASSRFLYGSIKPMLPSRFLSEDGIPNPVTKRAAMESTHQATPSASASYGYGSRTSHKTNVATPMTGTTTTFGKKERDPRLKAIGTHVEHTSFGKGTVTAFSDNGGIAVLTVKFDTVGNKTLSLDYAPLKVSE